MTKTLSFFIENKSLISNNVRDIKNSLLQQQQNVTNVKKKSIYSLPHLPFNDVEDFEQQTEQFLNRPNNFQASVIEVFRVGGKTLYKFIKRNCCRLITNELAEKYSWLGAKAKQKFCNLKIADLLIVSGQEHSDHFKKVFEKEIQKWLQRVKERLESERKNV
ncbi:hypothetical protein PUN28_008198 [Cardiocondyla obscurior]|uniref:DUF4806 domain-containing protein n=1 Tax=Cardiocondyla obscurior TaxID=286306 RepID=A0AAW2FYA5_9HYME